jgi:hypothetical protein
MGFFTSDDFNLEWEELRAKNTLGPRNTYRTKIPGGWLVSTKEYDSDGVGGGITFVPDPNHEWDGDSLE